LAGPKDGVDIVTDRAVGWRIIEPELERGTPVKGQFDKPVQPAIEGSENHQGVVHATSFQLRPSQSP
jgi:hypothetical protein